MNLLFSSIICKSLVNQQKSLCNQQLTISDQQFLYCQKANALQTTQIKESMHISQQSSHMFIYTDTVQNSQIQVEMDYVNVFAVFGFNKQSQNIQQSTVNVSLRFSVVQAALICLQCDLSVSQSVLVFQASGHVLSGVMLTAKDNLTLAASRVQFRFWSKQASGLVNQIQAKMTNFSLADVNITGFDGVQSADNGYLASLVSVSSPISTTRVLVCMDPMTARVGSLDKLAASSEQLACLSVCDAGTSYAYGLCLDDLRLGKYLEANDTYICVDPFVFNGESCFCKEGFLLDADKCLDVAVQLTNLDSWLAANISDIVGQLSNNADLAAKLSALDQHISGNASALNASIRASYDSVEAHLAQNTTGLDSKIDASAASINSQIQSNTAQLLKVVLNNSTALDQRISDNSSALNARLNLVNASMLDGVKKVYENITAVNATVSQLSANLDAGVASINTKLAALDANLLSNVTAINASIMDLKKATARDVSQINETLLNSTDQLQANISAVNATLLAVNGSLSSSISQVNGTLTAMNTTFINNISAINSTIQAINNSLLLNISSVNASMLSRTDVLQQNLTDMNATLSNLLVLANQRIDQLMLQIFDVQNQVTDLNQAELDPQFDVTDSSLDLVCAQQVFTQSFDITSITSVITASNFTGAFVFDAQLVNNSFIDVQDAALPSTYFYLFKSQSYFYNLKIQFGAQALNSGSLLSDSTLKIMNKVSLVQKSVTQITVSTQLNILSQSSSGTSLRNLFVKLTFAPSSVGGVDLINVLTGQLSVRNYQLAGTYYSTQQSCLGVMSVNGFVAMQNVNFNSARVTFGNLSSYLFCQVNSSMIQMQKIVVLIGVSDASPNVITGISTTSATDFAFGGIVATMNYSNIDFKISTLKLFSFYNTGCVNNSGQIFGLLNNSNIVSVSQICYQDSTKLQPSSTVLIGIIGYVEGVFSMSRSRLSLTVSGDAAIQGLGTVTFMTQLCTKALFSDLTVQVQLGSKTTVQDEQNVSALVGRQMGANWTVQNTVFDNNLLIRGKQIGTIAGFCQNTAGSIANVELNNASIASTQHDNAVSGGFIGQITFSKLNIATCSVNNQTHSSSTTNSCTAGYLVGSSSSATIFTSQVEVFNSSLNATSISTQSAAGFIAVVVSSSLNISASFYNSSLFSTSATTSNVFSSNVIGKMSQSTVNINNIEIMNSSVLSNCNSGDALASLIIASADSTSKLNAQNIQLYNTTVSAQSSAGDSFASGVVSILDSSSLNVENLYIHDSKIKGKGTAGSQGGIISQMLNANMNARNIKAFNFDCYLQSTVGNASIGGAIGVLTNSDAILQECAIEQINFTAYGKLWSFVGGYMGSINQSSTVFQIDSIIVNSTAYGESAGAETNVAGFFAMEQLFSTVTFVNCSVTSVAFNSSSTTCRSVLFGGRVENSTCKITKISITNSNATTAVAPQPRVGSLLGRVYYSSVNATQIFIQNIYLLSQSTIYDSYTGGITTSLGSSTFYLNQSTITNIVMKVTSTENNALAAAIGPTHQNSDLYITDVFIDLIKITAIAYKSSMSIYVSVVSGSVGSSGTDINTMHLTHFKIGSIEVIYSGSSNEFIGLMDGKSDFTTLYYITDSQSVGLYTVSGTVYPNCDPLKYFIDGSGQQYTTRRGC
ncbi:Hypothetical_protein [Hexamita inflata]|uniref:Hypothetical_protein n=1 Tax=Hexamita inflata TaxID=28002 RepID=A0AA86RC11_9EUKA|nr:Hypothetical protein HINF_LOCUS57922 [Hexamita inflata]